VIRTTLEVMDDFKKYAAPKARLTRLLKSGALVQIRRGLYVDDASISKRVLAPVIYGPSYISFQFALAAAGLIPERVAVVTSASFNKNKDKVFRTPLGEYRYSYLPPSVYPYGIRMEEEAGLSYLIATAEKALCDSVYKISTIASMSDIEKLLCEDWRMERQDLMTLDRTFIAWIAPMYRRKSLMALSKWFEKVLPHG
jgi:predicted transcriptional regulator of viral defense system